MQEYSIGEVLKKRRLELGLTQEEVGHGIYDSSNLSRIENGQQTPCRRKLIVLLQRLGLPEDRYYALVDEKEFEISELQSQISFCEIDGKFEQGLKKLIKLEQLVSSNDILAQQFILRVKSALGKLDSSGVHPYTFEEKQKMLLHALYLTSPCFTIETIEYGLYGIEEIKLINQLALTYSDNNQRTISINMYSQLLKYLQKHFREIQYSNPIIILIAYNYSRDLCFEHRIKDAIDIAMLGLNVSIETRRSTYLGGLLFILAYCFYESNEIVKSQDYFFQSYYAYHLMADSQHATLAQNALKELFDLDI